MAVCKVSSSMFIIDKDGAVHYLDCRHHRQMVHMSKVVQSSARQVSGGRSHVCIVTDAGHLLLCDSNELGKCNVKILSPRVLDPSLFDYQPVLMVACGFAHTLVLTVHNSVYTFGNNDRDQLGVLGGAHGKLKKIENCFHDEKIIFIAAGGDNNIALSEEGRVFAWGNYMNCLTPAAMPAEQFSGQKVIMASLSESHFAALTLHGLLFTWGKNTFGQLGLGDTDTRNGPALVKSTVFEDRAVRVVSCGRLHTSAITDSGALWMCGANVHEQLGSGDENIWPERHFFVKIPMQRFDGLKVTMILNSQFCVFAVTEDGCLWQWGIPYFSSGGSIVDALPFPARISNAEVNMICVGRFNSGFLSKDLVLGFAMATHKRLGKQSLVSGMPQDLIQEIIKHCKKESARMPGVKVGLLRLIGGAFHMQHACICTA